MLRSPKGMGMAPELHPDVWRGVWKNCQITNFIMPNNISSMKYALKLIPAIADVGVPQGDGDGPVALAPGPGPKSHLYPVDQREKLKGSHWSKAT